MQEERFSFIQHFEPSGEETESFGRLVSRRSLQGDDNDPGASTSAPTSGGEDGEVTPAPSPATVGSQVPTVATSPTAPTTKQPSSGGGADKEPTYSYPEPPGGYGWFLITLIVIVGLFIIWCLYGWCRKRREQRMLDMRSRQADRVLGDMQMVPNDDYDNELI